MSFYHIRSYGKEVFSGYIGRTEGIKMSGGSFPPLPPLSPPAPVQNSPLTAQLQAQGRRSGLRAALLSIMSGGKGGGKKATKLSGE